MLPDTPPGIPPPARSNSGRLDTQIPQIQAGRVQSNEILSGVARSRAATDCYLPRNHAEKSAQDLDQFRAKNLPLG